MTRTSANMAASLLLVVGLTALGGGALSPLVYAGEQSAAEQPKPKGEKPARTDRYGDPLPDGALARLGTLRLRTLGALLAFHPNGKTIVSVIGGRQVTLWDAGTGELCERRELPVQPPFVLFLSSDGRLLGVKGPDGDAPIDIWDVEKGKQLQKLQPPQRWGIYRTAFSSANKMLAVAEQGGVPRIIRLWDLASGGQRVLKGDRSSFDRLAFSPDGKLLAASDGRRVTCWDTSKGEQLWQTGGVHGVALAFTADGKTLIGSAGNRERAWHAWEAATGKPAEGLKLPEGYNYAEMAAAPDGRTLVFAQHRGVVGADGRVRIWDLQSGKLLHTLTSRWQIGPFAPDGKSFLTNDGALQRWELATGRPLLPDTDALGHSGEVTRAFYSPDGRRLASAAGDATIRLWDIATAKPLYVLRGRERVTDLAFTPDGKLLVSGSTEGELRVWDSEAGKEVRRIPLHDPKRGEKNQNVWKLHLTPDGRTVIVLGYDPAGGRGGIPEGILTRWDLATGQRKSNVPDKGSDGFYGAFAPDGRLLASRGGLIDTETGQIKVKLEGQPTPWMGHYAFSSDGRLVAGLITHTERDVMRISTKMDGIQIWEAASGRALRRIPSDWVGQLAFSPDGRYLTAADLDGLRLWELATGQVVLRHKAHERISGSYGQSFASCLSFAPDGRSLATGHRDSTVLIWSVVPSVHPPTAEELPGLWKEIGSSDASRAYAAHWRLAEAPQAMIRFFKERIRPASPVPAEEMRSLLADLESEEFRRREAAAARLRELGGPAAGAMRKALKSSPTLETRRRLETLLKALDEPPTGEALRHSRAVAVLERIGTTEARGLLKELAGGDAEARTTREAKAALERLTDRRQ